MDEPSVPVRFIVESASRSLDLGRRLLTGIEPALFARLPRAGAVEASSAVGIGSGAVIQTNHPAWVYGHLSRYPAMVLTICGLDPGPAAVPTEFETIFARDSHCIDDPEGTIYPPMDRITAAYSRGFDAVLRALPGVSAGVLSGPNPDPRLARVFPTVGFAVVFLLCNHPATHLGQVSAWRRCMGLGPA